MKRWRDARGKTCTTCVIGPRTTCDIHGRVAVVESTVRVFGRYVHRLVEVYELAYTTRGLVETFLVMARHARSLKAEDKCYRLDARIAQVLSDLDTLDANYKPMAERLLDVKERVRAKGSRQVDAALDRLDVLEGAAIEVRVEYEDLRKEFFEALTDVAGRESREQRSALRGRGRSREVAGTGSKSIAARARRSG